MSKFNCFARQLNTLAHAAAKEYREAETALKLAEQKENETPRRRGFVDADYVMQSKRAEIDAMAARENFNKVKRNLEQYNDRAADIRRALAKTIDESFSLYPEQIDTATIELLRAGIMKSGDFVRLMKEAQEVENPTMQRLIGKYASEEAERIADKNGFYDPDAVTLREVGYAGAAAGEAYLQRFDELVTIFRRCTTSNLALFDKWDELTGAVIEDF